MPLSLPVYLLGRTFVLHTRVFGRQLKRSLRTADPAVAKLRALELLRAIHMIGGGDGNPKFTDFDWLKLRRYEIDLKNGVLKATDEANHRRMMEALERIGPISGGLAPGTRRKTGV